MVCGLEDSVSEPGAVGAELDAEEGTGSAADEPSAEEELDRATDKPAESEAETDTGSEAESQEEDSASDTAEESESAKPHVHMDACYEDQMILTCSIEGHIHTDSCLTRSGDDLDSENLDSANSIEMDNAGLDTAVVDAADYEIAFKNTAIGLYETGTDMITFTISCPGADVTASEMSVASDGEGRFGLSFPADGDYTAKIRCSGSGAEYKCDARTLTASLHVENGTVTEQSRAFVLDGEQTGTLSVSRVEESCLRVLAWKIEKGLIKDSGDEPGPDVPIEETEAQYTSGGLSVNNTGTINIAGIVEYNTAGANGGGIAVENQSNAVMQNVVAAHNTAGGNGGGIYLDVSSKTMTLGGTPRITANQGGNLYLRSGAAVKLYGILGGSSIVGISTEALPTDAVPVQIGVANTSDGNYLYNSRSMFRSDNAKYSVSFRDAALYLVEGSGSHTGTSVEVNGILFQYYANLMEISDVGEASRRLDVIDTSGAVLPSNGVAPSIRYLYLNADGSVVREKKLKPVYAPRDVPENDLSRWPI